MLPLHILTIFFTADITVNQNIDDAVIGFFQSITGNKQSGSLLASTVIYTALSQGIDPMEFIDELRKLKNNNQTENKQIIDAEQFINSYVSYQEIENNKENYTLGQLFYIPALNLFYKLTQSGATHTKSINLVQDYYAEKIVSKTNEITYNYYLISYTREQNELNAYLTIFLNMNRTNTSLLGISNSPQTNKYIARSILL